MGVALGGSKDEGRAVEGIGVVWVDVGMSEKEGNNGEVAAVGGEGEGGVFAGAGCVWEDGGVRQEERGGDEVAMVCGCGERGAAVPGDLLGVGGGGVFSVPRGICSVCALWEWDVEVWVYGGLGEEGG